MIKTAKSFVSYFIAFLYISHHHPTRDPFPEECLPQHRADTFFNFGDRVASSGRGDRPSGQACQCEKRIPRTNDYRSKFLAHANDESATISRFITNRNTKVRQRGAPFPADSLHRLVGTLIVFMKFRQRSQIKRAIPGDPISFSKYGSGHSSSSRNPCFS